MLLDYLHQRFCVQSVLYLFIEVFFIAFVDISCSRFLFSPLMSYLGVCQAEHGSQLLSVRFGDVFLDLKSLLQPLPLQVREDGPGPRPFPLVRLRHRVLGQDCVRPWKTQGGGGGGEGKEEQKPGAIFQVSSNCAVPASCLLQPPAARLYLGRCPETDAGLLACHCRCRRCCCCLVRSSWRPRHSSRSLWRRSTGRPMVGLGCASLTDGSS